MTSYESAIKTIYADDEVIFNTLSNLKNAEKVKDKIPEDKVKNLKFEEDSISFSVNPVGDLKLKIVDKEAHKTIKFGAEKSPIDFFVWVQIKQYAEKESKLKVTLKAKLNPMIKMMLSGKLEEMVNVLADTLATFSYEE